MIQGLRNIFSGPLFDMSGGDPTTAPVGQPPITGPPPVPTTAKPKRHDRSASAPAPAPAVPASAKPLTPKQKAAAAAAEEEATKKTSLKRVHEKGQSRLGAKRQKREVVQESRGALKTDKKGEVRTRAGRRVSDRQLRQMAKHPEQIEKIAESIGSEDKALEFAAGVSTAGGAVIAGHASGVMKPGTAAAAQLLSNATNATNGTNVTLPDLYPAAIEPAVGDIELGTSSVQFQSTAEDLLPINGTSPAVFETEMPIYDSYNRTWFSSGMDTLDSALRTGAGALFPVVGSQMFPSVTGLRLGYGLARAMPWVAGGAATLLGAVATKKGVEHFIQTKGVEALPISAANTTGVSVNRQPDNNEDPERGAVFDRPPIAKQLVGIKRRVHAPGPSRRDARRANRNV